MPNRRAPTVVLVTDRTLFPPREGSQVRIIALVRVLKRAGFRVVLVARRAPWRRLPGIPGPRSTLRTWLLADALVGVDAPAFTGGSPASFDWTPYARALEDAVVRHRPVAVIAEYLWLAPCLAAVSSDIVRIVDTHDVMHVRAEMYRNESEGAWVECSEQEETELLSHADVIVAIQRHELETFARMLPSKRIVYVPHVVTSGDRPVSVPTRPIVGFVGSRIQGNVSGLRAFVDQGWPVVRARCPDAELHVFGDVVSRLERQPPGVHLVGVVSNVGQVYRTASVVINPVMLGTGLKIKTVEALAAGCAVVTTRCGAAGLEAGAPNAFVMEDHMPSFGIAVAQLLMDESRRRALGEAARAFAAREFGETAGVERVRAMLASTREASTADPSQPPEEDMLAAPTNIPDAGRDA